MNHSALIRIVISALALLAAPHQINAAPPPNIILIVADDLGYHDLGSYGNRNVKTPHLDQLARDGVRATSFYVTWPACTPSRGSILTGRYPQRNGLYDMIRNDAVDYGHRYTAAEYAISPEMTLGLDLREVTFADVLKKRGYTCGVVGKWDSGRARRFLPLQRGFDFFYGFANTGIDYWTHERYGVPSMFRGNARTEEDKSRYATDIFKREASKFIRNNKQHPFLLYLPFNAPHSASNLEKDSYQVPEKYLREYPAVEATDSRAVRRTKYGAMVTCLDAAIGEILEELKKSGLEDNTLVMFLSDNGAGGAGDNKPLRGGKTQMWEGGVRVPFIARWPGKIPPNTVTDEFLTSLELFPTMISAAGTEAPRNVKLDGFDMLPVLQGKAKSERAEMFWERRETRAARVENWKWVQAGGREELFDLSTDVSEKRDLSKELPEVLARMKSRFTNWKSEMDRSEPRGPFRNY